MTMSSIQEKATAAHNMAAIQSAQEEVEEALSTLEENIISASRKAERRMNIIELDPSLTKPRWLRLFWLGRPREFLKFQPYQQLWDKLEELDLKPALRLNYYSYPTMEFSWTRLAIHCRVPR